ncbi:hypothetical protein VBZ67_03530 [Campylobacter concisus]
MSEIHEIAEKILYRALESHEARKGIPVHIPQYEVEAKMGFSLENVNKILAQRRLSLMR